MTNNFLKLALLGSLAILSGCGEQSNATAGVEEKVVLPPPIRTERWYSEEQAARGEPLFQANCAVCHKPDASGAQNWGELNDQGKLPPPPLNGTAHTWHHPLSILRRTVRVGGVQLGGTMPGFADKLNTGEIDDILAWVQSHWPDKIYNVWSKRNAQTVKLSKKR